MSKQHKSEEPEEVTEVEESVKNRSTGGSRVLGVLKRFRGLVGLIVMLAVIVGVGFLVVRYENQSRLDDAQEQLNQQTETAAPETACFTLPQNLDFTTGNYDYDQVLAYALAHPENTEYTKFVRDFEKSSTIDTESPVYKDLKSKIPTTQGEVQFALQMSPAGVLSLVGETDKKYQQALTEYPADYFESAGMYRLDYQVYVTNDQGQKTNGGASMIVSISNKPGENTLVFPLQKPENGTVDGFAIMNIVPVCK